MVKITFVWKRVVFFYGSYNFLYIHFQSKKIRLQWYFKISHSRQTFRLMTTVLNILNEKLQKICSDYAYLKKISSFLTVVAIFSISFKIISFDIRLYYYCKMVLLQKYLVYRQIYGPFKRQNSKRNGQITFFEK